MLEKLIDLVAPQWKLTILLLVAFFILAWRLARRWWGVEDGQKVLRADVDEVAMRVTALEQEDRKQVIQLAEMNATLRGIQDLLEQLLQAFLPSFHPLPRNRQQGPAEGQSGSPADPGVADRKE